MSIKKCFCEGCPNTSANSPNKIFISVPSHNVKRELWYKAVGKKGRILSGRSLRCCEDHFDLSKDVINWQYFKSYGQRIVLKPGVLPRKNISASVSAASQLSPSSQKRKAEAIEAVRQELYCERKQPNLGSEQPDNESYKKRASTSPANKPFEQIKIIQNVQIASGILLPIVQSVPVCCLQIKQSVEKSQEFDSTNSDNVDNSIFDETVLKENGVDQYCSLEKETMLCSLDLQQLPIIVKATRLSYTDSMIILKKIRINDSFSHLGVDFGKTESEVREIFNIGVPKIATLMKKHIAWYPDGSKPQAREKYQYDHTNQYAMIHCFEIQIVKPSNLLQQVLTWCAPKKCYTIKYLISCTSDKMINFVSTGYGGSVTNSQVLEKSTFMSVIPPYYKIMTYEYFDGQVEPIICSKSVSLASVRSSSTEPTMSIYSLEECMEHLLKRLTEFPLLKTSYCLPSEIVPQLNNIMIIICGMVNLQELNEGKISHGKF